VALLVYMFLRKVDDTIAKISVIIISVHIANPVQIMLRSVLKQKSKDRSLI
jgi:cytochrome b